MSIHRPNHPSEAVLTIIQSILIALYLHVTVTVFTRLKAGAFTYLDTTTDLASKRDRRLIEAGVYCFKQAANDLI